MESKKKGFKFPVGNTVWTRRAKHGRDRIFKTGKNLFKTFNEYVAFSESNPWVKEETKAKAVDDIGIESETKTTPTMKPLSIAAFCIYCGVNSAYLRQLKADRKDDPDFSTVISFIYEVVETQQFEGAAVGAYNANIISRKLGLADKLETTNVNYETQITKAEAKEISDALENDV